MSIVLFGLVVPHAVLKVIGCVTGQKLFCMCFTESWFTRFTADPVSSIQSVPFPGSGCTDTDVAGTLGVAVCLVFLVKTV